MVKISREKAKLNPRQYEAVTTIEGPVLVLAGAGTGKTHTITERIAYLVDRGVSAETILAVTFTNKAAREMRERIVGRLGREISLSGMFIGTFHRLAVQILREHAPLFGYPRNFSIVAQGEQMGLIRRARKHVRGGASISADDLLFEIGRLKNRGISPAEMARKALEEKEHTLASVYRRYEESLRALRALDFDDLLLKSVDLLHREKAIREAWQGRFRYILVDEYQDTNAIQHRLITILAAPHRNLCVVGDDDQSIYAWRGASVHHILRFQEEYPDAKVIALEENYRSTPAILEVANAVIAHNPHRHPKKLWSRGKEGRPVELWVYDREEAEIETTLSQIRQAIAESTPPSECAILLRTNTQSRAWEEGLRAERIPYQILGGQSFFDRKEIRDLLAYLTVIANPYDDAALLRILNTPPRGIGEKTVETLMRYAQQHALPLREALLRVEAISSLGEKAKEACQVFATQLLHWSAMEKEGGTQQLIRTIIEESRYEEEITHLYDNPLEQAARRQTLVELEESLSRYLQREPGGRLAGFLQEAALRGREDGDKEDHEASRQGVYLLTAHSAKGLEFDRVWIPALEEGLFPHQNAIDQDEIPEERRLFYVAVTRARHTLTLSFCTERSSRGKSLPRTPSRFLEEIPPNLLRRQSSLLSPQEAKTRIAAICAMISS